MKKSLKKSRRDKFTDDINRAAMSKSLSDLMEVPSLNIAQQLSDVILENMGLTKAERRKVTFRLCEVRNGNTNYLTSEVQVYDACVLLRAVELNTKKFYVPRTVWAAMEDEHTGEPDVVKVISFTDAPEDDAVPVYIEGE